MALSPVPPNKISDIAFRPVAYPDQVCHTVPAYVSRDGSVACICRGPQLELYSTRSGFLECEFRFGSPTSAQAGPFVSLRHGNRSYMVVAITGGAAGPLLCISYCGTARVVQAITMPASVTKLAAVSGGRVGSMSGCVAVATSDGHVALIDLRLGDDGSSSEEKPASLSRQEAVDVGPASSYHKASHHGSVFVCRDVEVSLLKYIPQLDCLAIGLQEGLVHLWSLENNAFLFSVIPPSNSPAIAVALQEPENDPRCFCYLWVINGADSAVGTNCITSCFMYAVSFTKKQANPEGRCIYQGFQSCRQVFEYTLNAAVVGLDEEASSSLLVSCRTLPSTGVTGDVLKQQEYIEDLRLLLLTWQLFRGHRLLGTYVSVFDLNQWYRALMPGTYRCNALKLCPYVGLFSLDEAVAACGSRRFLDIRVIPSSVKKFRSPNPLVEQTHFPASLAFECICITQEGSILASFLGMQRQLLYAIQELGPSCLSTARDLLVRCTAVGLVSEAARRSSHRRSNPVAQNALLSLALEYRMVGFLQACLRHRTATPGDQSGEPLLPFMLNWVWNSVKEIKESLDTLYVPLFDCSGRDMEEGSFLMASHLGELTVLTPLLDLGRSLASGDVDVELVDLRREVLAMVKNHVEVVLFLVDCELLPEQRSSDAPAYPWPVLHDWYQRRREDFGLPLLVDVLVEKAGDSLPWDSGDYPPPSVQQALEVYLLRGLAPWAADALCLYFLLDVASFLKEEHSQVEKKLGQFPVAVRMSADLQSFVEAIWKLDHGFYKDGVESLLEATRLAESPVSALLGTIWPMVLRHLMAAEEYALALRYMGRRNFSIETVDHVELHLDVWLANNRVVDALELIRNHERLCGMDHLLRRIVALEHTMGDQVAKSRLELMLRLPLSRSEEDALSSFFHDLGQTTWLCHLIIHFVQGGRVEAAVPLANRLRDIFRGLKGHQFGDSEAYQQTEAVLELVQAFLRVRPLSRTSYHRAAPCPTVSAGAPLQGPIPTKVVHKGTTPSLASRTMAQVGKEEAGADKHPPPRGRQEVVFPRFVPAAISTSGPSTPVSALHLTKRLSLQSGLEADALSLLRTPPVKPWSPPAVVKGSSLGGARTSTPASILKPRVSLVRPIAVHAETPPTPPALSAEPCPTPDAATRRLRFAMSDSSASDNGLDLEETPIDSSAPEQQSDASRSREESVEQTVASDESANCSFLTAAGSTSDAESGTELEDESPRQVSAFHPQAPEQGAPTRPSHNIRDDTHTPSPPPPVFPEGTPLAEEVFKEDIEKGTELAEEEGCASGSPVFVGRPEPSSVGLSVEEAGGSARDAAVAETFEPEESGVLQWRDEPGDCTAPRTLQISSFKVGVSIEEPTAVADGEPTADIICVGVYPEGTDASLDGSCSIPMLEERDEEEDIVLILSDDESEQAHADVASTEDSCEDSDEEDEHIEQESDRQVPRLGLDATGTTLEDKRSLDASSVATEEEPSSASQPETHDQAAQTGQSLVGASFSTDQGESERHCDQGPGSKNDAEEVKGGSPTPRTNAEEAHVPSEASAWTGHALQPEERSGNVPELGARTDVHSAAGMPTEDSSSSASSAMSDPLLRRVSPRKATSERPSPVVSSYLLRRSVREEQEHPNVTVRTRRSSGPTTPARKPIQASPKSARSTRRSGSVDPSSLTSMRKLRTPSPEKEQSTTFSIARSGSALGRTHTRGARGSSESSTRKDLTPSPQKVPGTPKGKGASQASSKNEGATARGRVSPARTRRGESSSPKGRGTPRAVETPSPLPRLARLSVLPLKIESEGSTVAETTRRVAQTPSPSKLRRGQTSPRKARTPSPAEGPRSPKRKQRRSSTPSLAKEPPSPNNKRVSLSVLKDNQLAAAEPNSPERSPTRLPKPPVRRSTRLTPRKQAPEDSADSLEEMQVRLQSARKSAGGSSRKLPVILEDDAVVDDVAGQPSTKRLSSPHKSLPRIAAVEVPMTRLRSRQLSGDAAMEGAVAGTAKRKIETDAELATPAAKLHKPDALAKKDAQAAGPSSGPLFSPPLTRRRSVQRSTADRATPLEPATSRNSAAQRDAASASSTLSTSGRSRASPSVQAARKRVKKLVWKKRSLRVPLLPRSEQSSAKEGSAKP